MKIHANKQQHLIQNAIGIRTTTSVAKIANVVGEILSYISDQFAYYFRHLHHQASILKESLVSILIDKVLPHADLVRGGQAMNIASRAAIARTKLRKYWH